MFLNRVVTAVLLVLVCLTLAAAAGAVGGVYIDDLQYKNSGSIIFSDNFNDGSISDWASSKDVSLGNTGWTAQGSSLYMNWHGGKNAYIERPVSVQNPGGTTLSAWFRFPYTGEQWTCQHSGWGYVKYILYSDTTNAALWLSMRLDHRGSSQYDLAAGWSAPGKGGEFSSGRGVRGLGAQKVSVTFDRSGHVCGFLDDPLTSVIYLNYEPDLFPSFTRMAVETNYGDGSPVPEPCAAVALLSGITGTAFVFRRKR